MGWGLKCGIRKLPSAGLDSILPEFLIYLGDKSKHSLVKLINLTWTSGIHSDWHMVELISIFKIGKHPRVLSSFLSIIFTSVLCKVTEYLIVNRLNFYLEKFNFLSNSQAGF